MILTSTDVFLYVAAFCALGLTFFMIWLLYYAIMIIRDVRGVVGDMKRRFEGLDHLVHLVTEKLDHTSSALQMVVDGVSRVASAYQTRKTAAKPRRSARS